MPGRQSGSKVTNDQQEVNIRSAKIYLKSGAGSNG